MTAPRRDRVATHDPTPPPRWPRTCLAALVLCLRATTVPAEPQQGSPAVGAWGPGRHLEPTSGRCAEIADRRAPVSGSAPARRGVQPPSLRELGFDNTRLLHDGVWSLLPPGETDFVVPQVPWRLYRLTPNRIFNAATGQRTRSASRSGPA